jgi:hypothetical protein
MSKRTWKLSKNQKAYIVVRLACYDSPAAIRKSVKEEFGIEITPQALERYNPTRSTGRACPEQWATLFYETRRKLVEGRVDIGVAHKMARIRWLDLMLHRRMIDGKTREARALLKQAAEEMSQIAEQRHDGCGAAYSEFSMAELKARVVAAAAKLGLALVPIGALAAPGGDGAAGETQPPGEPVSG